jgi:hypothetical protein
VETSTQESDFAKWFPFKEKVEVNGEEQVSALFSVSSSIRPELSGA